MPVSIFPVVRDKLSELTNISPGVVAKLRQCMPPRKVGEVTRPAPVGLQWGRSGPKDIGLWMERERPWPLVAPKP